ncbi:MAG: hypothetical protein ABR866_16505 [Candidatus Korobacteraceae bacterium]|jgi:hypothetical protein
MGAAQTTGEHRQAYLALIYHVRPADMEKFVQSNRQYSAALASHGVSGSLLRWTAYADEDTFTFLWLHPIEHLNDIEELSKAESQLDVRIRAEGWNAGSDLHYAVDHTQEFVIRDEPSLSRLPADAEAWTHQDCEFQLYYTSGGYGGSDSEVRELRRKYLSAFPQKANHPYYRILRVLIGLERPLWVVQHCGASWQQIKDQQSEEAKLTGAAGASTEHTLLTFVRKAEVWRYQFDADMSYPLTSNPKAVP